jgi:PhnB protein
LNFKGNCAEAFRFQLRLQKPFWAAGFGLTRDRFGIPWMVNCAQPASS